MSGEVQSQKRSGGALGALSAVIDRVNTGLGHAVAWTAPGLVAVQFAAVVLRYVFGLGWIWIEESIVYLHATLFMAGAAYTLLRDGHVRLDIFYRDATPRAHAWVDLLGSLVFLIPFATLIVIESWPYVSASWAIFEGSPETSGIPAVFLLKSLIPLFAVTVGLQGLSLAVTSALALAAGARDGGAVR